MEPLLNLPRDQFLAALAELQLEPERTNFLVEQYDQVNAPAQGAGGRGMMYNLLDNIIGYDDDIVTPGERFGAGVQDFASGLLSDPLGTGADIVRGGYQTIEGAMAPGATPMDVLGAAGMAMGAGGLAARPAGSVGMGGRVRDPNLYHPASNVKLQRPVGEMEFGVSSGGPDLSPEQALNIEDLYGRVLAPAFGDRTRAGGLLSSIMGEELSAPVTLQGGADFMRSPGGIWASEPDAMRTRATALERIADEYGQEPTLAYTAMGAQAGDFSRMMSDAIMGQMRPSRSNEISPEIVPRYDARIRDTVDPEWPGILSPNAREYVGNMTGSNRRLLWQEMDRTAYRDAGFPDVGAARLAITDARLLDAQPFDTGLTFGRVDLSSGVTPTPRDVHETYGARIEGEYVGGLPAQVPGEIIWRDFFNARREAGARTSSDQRAFMMTPSIRQVVDEQMIEDVNNYLRQVQR
jgi:hypothetical protein